MCGGPVSRGSDTWPVIPLICLQSTVTKQCIEEMLYNLNVFDLLLDVMLCHCGYVSASHRITLQTNNIYYIFLVLFQGFRSWGLPPSQLVHYTTYLSINVTSYSLHLCPAIPSHSVPPRCPGKRKDSTFLLALCVMAAWFATHCRLVRPSFALTLRESCMVLFILISSGYTACAVILSWFLQPY